MQDTSQNIPNVDNFKNAFKPYLIRWSIVYTVLITFIIFITVCISIRSWDFSQLLISWFMDIGAIFDGKYIHYGIITLGEAFVLGIVSIGGAFVLGIVSIGISAVGVLAFGTNVAGVFAFGVNAAGVIAIGTNAVGVIAIGVNAAGIVAIGYHAAGFYVLSYSERCRGRYLFAPHRQDTEAVNFFSRWFPKLSEVVPT